MAISFGDIAELVARFGNSVVQEQANLAAPFVGKGTIKKEKHTGTVGIVNVKAGGISSSGFISDGGSLPTGESTDIDQLAYHPKALFSRLSIPRIAALTAVSKQDGVNLVKEQMESTGADLGRLLGRAVFRSGAIDSPFAATGSTTITVDVVTSQANQDVSAYRLGAAYIGLQDDDATPANVLDLALIVSLINYSTNTVTFSVRDFNATTGVIGGAYSGGDDVDNTSVALRPADGGALANSMTSLLDLAEDTLTGPAGTTLNTAGNYSGINLVAGDFVGNEVSSSGNLTIEDLDNLSKKVKRRAGKPWTHTVMNSENLHNYMSLLVTERRFVGGSQAADASVSSATFEGKPIIVDENMPNNTILIFSDMDVKLAEWRSFEPDYDGKKAAMVSDLSFVYDTQIFGLYNLRAIHRKGLGKLTDLTGASWA